jgi:L-lactate permease
VSAATASNSTDNWLFYASVAQRILLPPATTATATTANTAVTAAVNTAAAAAAGSRLRYFAASDGYLFQTTLSAASALRLRLCIMRCPPYHVYSLQHSQATTQ